MARPTRIAPVSVVRAAYRLDLDDEAWLAELVERSRLLLGDGFGGAAHTFDARDPAHVKPLCVTFDRASSEATASAFHGWHTESPLARFVYEEPTPCQTMSGYLGARFARDRAVSKYLHPIGAATSCSSSPGTRRGTGSL
jgi:hypothetical protein